MFIDISFLFGGFLPLVRIAGNSPGKDSLSMVKVSSEPSRKSGIFDQFSYGYLGFDLGPDKETLYYLTGGPIYIEGKRDKGVDEIAMGAAKGS